MNIMRARIIRGLPKPGEPARAELVMRAENRKLRDIMSDKPGRSFASAMTGRRSAMAYRSDPLLHDQIDFLSEVLALLEVHRRAGDFDRLTIVASPHMLGLLRAKMPDSLKPVISREIAKNLAVFPEATLPAILRQAVESTPAMPG